MPHSSSLGHSLITTTLPTCLSESSHISSHSPSIAVTSSAIIRNSIKNTLHSQHRRPFNKTCFIVCKLPATTPYYHQDYFNITKDGSDS